MFIRELLEAVNIAPYETKIVSDKDVTLKNGIDAFLEMFTILDRKAQKVVQLGFSLKWGEDEHNADFDGFISHNVAGEFSQSDYPKILSIVARKVEQADLNLPKHVSTSTIAALQTSFESKKFYDIIEDVLGDFNS